MCDYSLSMYRTRPAQAGERYVTHRFDSGSVGLISPGDCETAVCIPVDTRLMLDGIPEDLQRQWRLARSESATFVRLDRGPFFDGIRFANGTEVPLQAIGPGIRVVVTETVEELARKLSMADSLFV